MELKFSVFSRVAKPVPEVFEAVVNPSLLSRYFTTGGANGRLETGATVTWDFHDFPGAFPVQVVEVKTNERIVLLWDANDPSSGEGAATRYKTRVTMSFEALEGNRTLVTISEEGWRETSNGLNASYGNCMGWSQMLCALKIFLEHGINIREGMYK